MIKPMTDCFAYDTCCRALKVGHCQGEHCGFYKTKEQNDAELMKYNGTTNLVEIAEMYAGKKCSK